MSGLNRSSAFLYDPSPLDRWIGTPIRQDWKTGKYVNLTTGEALDAEATADYKRTHKGTMNDETQLDERTS